MKKLVMWPRYAALGASSRLRFMQFVPALERSGYQVEYNSFFDDAYLQKLYSGKGKSLTELIKAWQFRYRAMRQTPADVPALIEYELLPYLPYSMEKKFLDSRKYVLNFDDDVTLRYRKIPFLRDKFFRLVSGAAGVIVANAVLEKLFAPYNCNILYLPTVPPPLPEITAGKAEKFTLIWTGTPVTFPYLLERQQALRLAAEKLDFKLLVVGGDAAVPGVDCEVIPWSETAEIAALARAHAGIMPLPDTPFARGKSAYKLIRYLQAGLPAVASPVGENCRVLTPECGFLAGSDAEWVSALTALADPELRGNMLPAIRREREKYSLAAAEKRLTGFLEQIFHADQCNNP